MSEKISLDSSEKSSIFTTGRQGAPSYYTIIHY